MEAPLVIPRSILDNYNDGTNQALEALKTELRVALSMVDYSRDVADVRNDVIAIMGAYCDAAATTGARLSAEFYRGMRELQTGKDTILSLQSGRRPQETEKAVKAFINTLLEGDEEAFEALLEERLELEYKKAIAYNTIDNVRNDPEQPRFARVPTGEKTCDFCIMLASRGPVYLTEESAGAFTKFHAHCDCKVVPFWRTKANGWARRKGVTLEGYNPDEYYRQYQKLMEDPLFEARMARASERAKERARERKQ